MRRVLTAMLWLVMATAPMGYATNSSATNGSANSSATNSASSFLHNFADLALVDQTGRAFTADQLQDHVVLFNFIFTGCGSTCPMQTRALSQVMQSLPDEVRSRVRFVSVSIDPQNDTPAKMRTFAKQMQADLDGWLFLTGNVSQLQALAEKLHLLDEDTPNSPQIHRTSLWLVDRQGRMLQRYRGNPPDRDRLTRELIQVSHLPLTNS